MKLKTYETPEVDLLKINTEVNFCESATTDTGLIDFGLLDSGDITWLF